MGMLLRILLSRGVGPVCAGLAMALAAALVVASVGGRAREAELRRALVAAEARLSGCETRALGAEAALDRQAQAVSVLEAEGRSRRQAAERAAAEARRIAPNARGAAAAVLSARPEGGVCEAADRLILKAAGAGG